MKKVVEFYVKNARGVDVLLGTVVVTGSLGMSNLVKLADSIGVTGWNYAACGSEKMYIDRNEKHGVVGSGNIERFVMNRKDFSLGLLFVEGYKLAVGVDVPRVKGWGYPVIDAGKVEDTAGEAPTGSEGNDVVDDEVKDKPKSRIKKKKD